MGPDKIDHLVTRHPDTRLALAKWDRSLAPLRETVTTAAQTTDRTAPIDLLGFPRTVPSGSCTTAGKSLCRATI